MANFGGLIVTNTGVEKTAEAIESSYIIHFTKIALGEGIFDSNCENITNPEQVSALSNPVNEWNNLSIHYHSRSGNIITLSTYITNESIESGHFITEVGVYAELHDSDGNVVENEFLYAYSACTQSYADYIPTSNTMYIYNELVFHIAITQKATVTIQTEPGNFVSRAEFNKIITNLEGSIASSINEILDLYEKTENNEVQITDIQRVLNSLSQSINDLQQKISTNLEDSVASNTNKILDLYEKTENNEVQITDIQDVLNSLSQSINNLQQKVSTNLEGSIASNINKILDLYEKTENNEVQITDIQHVLNSLSQSINDLQQQVSTNYHEEDLTFPNPSKGVVLVDRNSGQKYRLLVENGSLMIEPVTES